MQKGIIPFSIILLLIGCMPGEYRGSGIDKIPISACTKCNTPPFYVNGQWIERHENN